VLVDLLCEEVKRDVQRTVDDLIANIEAKKQTIFAAMEDQTKKSLQRKRKLQIPLCQTILQSAGKAGLTLVSEEIKEFSLPETKLFQETGDVKLAARHD